MTNTAPSAPWVVAYGDGAANHYRFALASAGGQVDFEYTPITPATSSTGTYSGGDPCQARFAADDPRIEELWRRVERFAGDRAAHVDERMKGTGAFTLSTPAGNRSFIVEGREVLQEFDGFLAAFRR